MYYSLQYSENCKYHANRPDPHDNYESMTFTSCTSNKKKMKLEIWGKDQRESARRPKSDWGKLKGRIKFSRHQSHVARTQMHWQTLNAHCRLRVGQHEHL